MLPMFQPEQRLCVCKTENYYFEVRGPHVGCYCSGCNGWIQWVKQDALSEKEAASVRPQPKDTQESLF